MKDELNSYGIINSDGVSQSFVNEGKVSFDNDRTDYISEWEKSAQGEMISVSETYDDQKVVREEESEGDNANIDLSLSSSTASATSASIGGGGGALAGAVAAGVAAAVVVVAAFLSTLTINLSLLMASMTSLTFKVEMSGAQEEDFVKPIFAVLTGDDGVYLEQEIKQDSLLLTFDNLESGKEYFLTVKNEEKVFAEVSAFTATEPNDKGDIVSRMQGTEVVVSVRKAELKANEFYTLIAKDAKGNVVFSKDGVDTSAEYTFTVDEPKDLYFYLMVNGKTYAFSQILLPDYDFAGGVWTWNDDFTAATVTFTDTKGGESLVLNATVTRKTVEPACEEDGSITYTAETTYQGKNYTDKKIVVLESVGHEYEGVLGEDGRITYTCPRCGDTYTD